MLVLVTRSKLWVSILGKYANCVDTLFHYTIRRFLLSEDDKGKDSSKACATLGEQQTAETVSTR